ncbi:MAG: hypothetical protein ACR2MP_20880 [Streptosporangiaceae bacterium]
MIGALDLIGRSLDAGLSMFWDRLWALILDFGLSGTAQAFVSRRGNFVSRRGNAARTA